MTVTPERLQRALRALDDPPAPPGWNRDMLTALDAPLREIPAAVLLALRGSDDDPELLFTRRAERLSKHAGQVSFPGGHVEAGDRGAVGAALREAEEEIALPAATVTPLGYLDCLDTISGFCVTPVVARIAGDPPLRADPGEVAELFAVPLAFLLDPANRQMRSYRSASGTRSLPEFHYAGHRIWGATALILANLQQRLATT